MCTGGSYKAEVEQQEAYQWHVLIHWGQLPFLPYGWQKKEWAGVVLAH